MCARASRGGTRLPRPGSTTCSTCSRWSATWSAGSPGLSRPPSFSLRSPESWTRKTGRCGRELPGRSRRRRQRWGGEGGETSRGCCTVTEGLRGGEASDLVGCQGPGASREAGQAHQQPQEERRRGRKAWDCVPLQKLDEQVSREVLGLSWRSRPSTTAWQAWPTSPGQRDGCKEILDQDCCRHLPPSGLAGAPF